MKLLLFIHSLASGGAERVLATLAGAWAERGWPVSLVTLASANADFYRLHPGIERIALDLARDSANPLEALWNNGRHITAVRRTLQHCRPDVAIGFMTVANILLALAAARLPGLVTVGAERAHPPMLPLGPPWETLRRWSYGRLDAVVAQTERSAAWLAANTTAGNIRVIPNPVVWPLAAMPPLVPPDSVGRTGRRRLLAVGRLVPQKGFDLLIAAFAACADRFPDWELVIVGEGPDRTELQAQIDMLGLGERVLLAGRAGNIGHWYERAQVYVLSSRFEGMPNALLEAMCHGLPVVSVDCETGPREIIRHGADGWLVPPNDAGALAEGMATLMADVALRQRLGTGALAVRSRYSLAAVAAEWASFLADLGAPRRAHRARP